MRKQTPVYPTKLVTKVTTAFVLVAQDCSDAACPAAPSAANRGGAELHQTLELLETGGHSSATPSSIA